MNDEQKKRIVNFVKASGDLNFSMWRDRYPASHMGTVIDVEVKGETIIVSLKETYGVFTANIRRAQDRFDWFASHLTFTPNPKSLKVSRTSIQFTTREKPEQTVSIFRMSYFRRKERPNAKSNHSRL